MSHSAETRAKISAALRGKRRKPLSPEHAARISASNMGRHVSMETRLKIGEARRGKAMSPLLNYGLRHQRLRKRQGSAKGRECFDCGKAAEQWSLDWQHIPPKFIKPDPTTGAWFSIGPDSHYVPRCKPCHRGYDA